MILEANEIYFNPNDEGCAIAGFKSATEAYVLVSRDLEPTEQDISLNLAGIHLEFLEQGWRCYDGISRFMIYPEKIEIELNTRGALATQQERIEIRYDSIPERRTQLRAVLRTIFEAFPSFTDVA